MPGLEQFCMGLASLSLCHCLSIPQGLKASAVISPYGLVWASSQNEGLKEVNTWQKKISKNGFFHS